MTHPNAELIARFYDALSRRDAEAMAACYHPEVEFSDPVFPALRGTDAGDMWRMLCARGKDLRIEASDIAADDAGGRAHLEAWYTFSATGRAVHNRIDARFAFRDGLIHRHTDTFDFHAWAAQALGPLGRLLGWSGFFKGKVRRQAAASLDAFSGRGDDFIAGVRPVPAAANPFGLDLWDCRSFTHHAVAVTSDPEIARRFGALRASDGAEHRGHEPPNAQRLPCSFAYPCSERPADGPLFKAREMEDKWDIYLLDGILYFCRSWTGQLDYCAPVGFEASMMTVSAVTVSGDNDPILAPRIVDFLIKSHLLGLEVPHPLPPGLAAQPQPVALYSMSMFGRRGSYGTYADPTSIEAIA